MHGVSKRALAEIRRMFPHEQWNEAARTLARAEPGDDDFLHLALLSQAEGKLLALKHDTWIAHRDWRNFVVATNGPTNPMPPPKLRAEISILIPRFKWVPYQDAWGAHLFLEFSDRAVVVVCGAREKFDVDYHGVDVVPEPEEAIEEHEMLDVVERWLRRGEHYDFDDNG